MLATSDRFKGNARAKLADDSLQSNLRRFGGGFADRRRVAVGRTDDFEGLRDRAAEIRAEVLENLDHWLIAFEAEALRRGTRVHWAETGADANRIVLEIARAASVARVVKSKSMVSEESGLNAVLEGAGITVTETDLGEYILQLADEPPSHIIAPAIHKSRDQVSDLFAAHHGTPRTTDIPALCEEAREQLRPRFLAADMGISGGNFLIAETGSVAIVTNEGNGRMVTTLPRVHVAITGIEKVLPTLDDLAAILRVLPRSATGQDITNYVSVLTGTRDPGATDGPVENHVILVDNGRSRLIGSDLHAALRCIRCGACMNHCPVYQNIGGHAYGWVYPGPIGAILTPAFLGLEKALDLPQASTLCAACEVVCPVRIPLPELMRVLREQEFSRGLRPWHERLSIRLWRTVALHPRLYALASRWAVRLLHALAGRDGMLHRLPGLDGWTEGRDMPAPQGSTFRDQWRKRRKMP
jgi:L-lactate dehydrogenase complex protein LldF